MHTCARTTPPCTPAAPILVRANTRVCPPSACCGWGPSPTPWPPPEPRFYCSQHPQEAKSRVEGGTGCGGVTHSSGPPPPQLVPPFPSHRAMCRAQPCLAVPCFAIPCREVPSLAPDPAGPGWCGQPPVHGLFPVTPSTLVGTGCNTPLWSGTCQPGAVPRDPEGAVRGPHTDHPVLPTAILAHLPRDRDAHDPALGSGMLGHEGFGTWSVSGWWPSSGSPVRGFPLPPAPPALPWVHQPPRQRC